MKKRNILIFPLSLVCLAALTGCKNPGEGGGGGGTDTPDPHQDFINEIDSSIDKGLTTPSKLSQVDRIEAASIFKNVKSNMSKLRMTTSEQVYGSDYTALIPSSYGALSNKELTRSKITTKIYNGVFETIDIDRYQTLKHGTYSSSLKSNINTVLELCSDDDQLWYNQTYNYEGYTGKTLKSIGRIESFMSAASSLLDADYPTTSEDRKNYLFNYFFLFGEKFKLGWDDDSTDQGNLYYDGNDKNNCYIRYENPYKTEFVAPFDQTKKMKVVLNDTYVVHFENRLNSWYVDSLAIDKCAYALTDLSGNALSSPTPYQFSKYVTKAEHGDRFTNLPDAVEKETSKINDRLVMTVNHDNGKEAKELNDASSVVFYDSTLITKALNNDFNGYTYTSNLNKSGISGSYTEIKLSKSFTYYEFIRQLWDKKFTAPDFISSVLIPTTTYSVGTSIEPVYLDKNYLYSFDLFNYKDESTSWEIDKENLILNDEFSKNYVDVVTVDGKNFIQVKESGYYYFSLSCDAQKDNKIIQVSFDSKYSYTAPYYKTTFTQDDGKLIEKVTETCYSYDPKDLKFDEASYLYHWNEEDDPRFAGVGYVFTFKDDGAKYTVGVKETIDNSKGFNKNYVEFSFDDPGEEDPIINGIHILPYAFDISDTAKSFEIKPYAMVNSNSININVYSSSNEHGFLIDGMYPTDSYGHKFNCDKTKFAESGKEYEFKITDLHGELFDEEKVDINIGDGSNQLSIDEDYTFNYETGTLKFLNTSTKVQAASKLDIWITTKK